MHWVVQDNLYNEYGYVSLMETLERYRIPHTVIKIIPFIHDIEPDLVFPKDQLVYTCGATTMTNVAIKKGWNPGSFLNENFDHSAWVKNYGKEVLNYDAVVVPFKDAVPPADNFFIRPVHDTKSFNGQIYEKENFLDWQRKVVDLKEDAYTLTADTPVVVGTLKNIYQEYRFFVVDGKVITGSLYKRGDRVVHDSNIDYDTMWYVSSMVERWQPARAFVIDIAYGDFGYKVLEINNINSAGFYACNVPKIVEAIESMIF